MHWKSVKLNRVHFFLPYFLTRLLSIIIHGPNWRAFPCRGHTLQSARSSFESAPAPYCTGYAVWPCIVQDTRSDRRCDGATDAAPQQKRGSVQPPLCCRHGAGQEPGTEGAGSQPKPSAADPSRDTRERCSVDEPAFAFLGLVPGVRISRRDARCSHPISPARPCWQPGFPMLLLHQVISANYPSGWLVTGSQSCRGRNGPRESTMSDDSFSEVLARPAGWEWKH